MVALCIASGALGWFAARASMSAPAPAPACPSCPTPIACPAQVAQAAQPPAKASDPKPGSMTVVPVPGPVAAPSVDTKTLAAELRACVVEQRAYAGTTIVLKLVTDATGKVKSADVQGGEFLTDPERRCVKQRARAWRVSDAAEEVLVHVAL